MDTIEIALAEQLRMEAARLNVTQSHIAKETGLSLRSVSRYLNGERSIKISDLKKICDAMGVSAPAILKAADDSLK